MKLNYSPSFGQIYVTGIDISYLIGRFLIKMDRLQKKE